jgi:hypothetical protein
MKWPSGRIDRNVNVASTSPAFVFLAFSGGRLGFPFLGGRHRLGSSRSSALRSSLPKRNFSEQIVQGSNIFVDF